MTAWPVLAALALLVGTGAPAARLGAPRAPATRVQGARRLVPVAAGLATLLFLAAGRATIVFAALIAVTTAAIIIDGHRGARRSRGIEAATITLLGLVVAELRAGALIGDAFARCAQALPDTAPADVRHRFSTIARLTAGGAAGHTALSDIPELTGLARIWEVAHTHGLPAAPLLEQARLRLSARARHRCATTASLQGPQATAAILSALPLAGIALGSGMGASPLTFLLSGGIGGLLLVTGVGLICGGLLVSRAIISRASA